MYLDFYKRLDSMEDKTYIENFLVYKAALVIAGVKPAVTITIKKDNHKLYGNWTKFGNEFINDIKLNYIELRQSDDAIILMIYDRFVLEKLLFSENSNEFLLNIGYPSNSSIDDYLNTLKLRYEKYHCPHELGLFLGIPIEDVKDFMECTTKKCLLCGYWKVYNDSNDAKRIFTTYDKIKEYTIKNMLKGDLSHKLALSIRMQNNILNLAGV